MKNILLISALIFSKSSLSQTFVYESDKAVVETLKDGSIKEIEGKKTIVVDFTKKRILISPIPSFGNLTITSYNDATTPSKTKYYLYNFRCIDDNVFTCKASLLYIENESKSVLRITYSDYDFFYFISKEIK